MSERRLYGKFTLDYPDSHKIAPLSDGAFRAHVEMVLWSRRYLTDGKIPAAMALVIARRRPKVLVELTTNDPEHPSLVKDENGDYWLHDFLEHQSSRADVEAIKATNSANGAKGGQAKAKRTGKRAGSDSLSETVANVYTETQTETKTPLATDVASGGARKRATRLPDPFLVTADMRQWAATEVPAVDVDRSTRTFVDYWRAAAGRTAAKQDWEATWRNWLRRDADRTTTSPARRESSLDRRDRQVEQMFRDLSTTGPLAIGAPE